MKFTFLDKYEAIKPFREYEIWILFKITALSEACGWAFLIYSIVAERHKLFGHGWALPLFGSVHGMVTIAYFLLVLTGYSSLGWHRIKGLIGIVASVVPFGTLVFEIYAAHVRKQHISDISAVAPTHQE